MGHEQNGKRPNRCDAVRADGKPCCAWAVAGSTTCLSHDQGRAKLLLRSRRLGGINRRRRHDAGSSIPDVGTPMGIIELLNKAAIMALESSQSLATAKALASIASSAARALQALHSEELRLTYPASGDRDEPAVFTLEIPSLRHRHPMNKESDSSRDLRLIDYDEVGDSYTSQENRDD